MTNQQIVQIAMTQSAIELNCQPEDFLLAENKIVPPFFHQDSRKYLTEPFVCQMVSYGNNIVASVREDLQETVRSYLGKYQMVHCFETPNMHMLNDELQQKGLRLCFMAEYFLPDVEHIRKPPCQFSLKILTAKDFTELYLPQWSNALCEDRKELDVLGVGAYDGEKLIGLAGCSADCRDMWQIGVDVLPEYRRKGVASALTGSLAAECLKRGKVPFYCAAWSNIRSVRNALKAGFYPAWVEMTAKTAEFVKKMNQ